MAEDILGENEREDGSASGNDNRGDAVEVSDLCISFVSELVGAIRAADESTLCKRVENAGIILETLLMCCASFVVNGLVDPEPRDWLVGFSTEGSRGYVTQDDEMVVAPTHAEAMSMAKARARKLSTMDRLVTVAYVREMSR